MCESNPVFKPKETLRVEESSSFKGLDQSYNKNPDADSRGSINEASRAILRDLMNEDWDTYASSD